MSSSNLIWGPKAPTAGMFYISGITRSARNAAHTSRPETRGVGCSLLPVLRPSFQRCHLPPGRGGDGGDGGDVFTGSRHQGFTKAEFPLISSRLTRPSSRERMFAWKAGEAGRLALVGRLPRRGGGHGGAAALVVTDLWTG